MAVSKLQDLIGQNELGPFLVVAAVYIVFSFLDPSRVHDIYRFGQPSLNSVTAEGITGSHLFNWVVGWCATWFLGVALILPFFRQRNISLTVIGFSAFSVGFTCSLGIIRLVTLVFRNGYVFIPTVLALLAVGGVRLHFYLKDHQIVSPRWDRLRVENVVLFAVASTVLFLAIQVQAGEFSWVGHGPNQYSYYIKFLHVSSLLPHFPIITQHYDELLFHYFLTDGLPFTFAAIVPVWITLALNKVSFIALTYGLFRYLGIDRKFSVLSSGFLFFGTCALSPIKYLMMIDIGNPLFQIVHSGRLIGIELTLLILVDILTRPKTNGHSGLGPLFYLLSGFGLVMTSLSNLMLLGFVFVGAILARLTQGESSSPSPHDARALRIFSGPWSGALFGSALFFPALTYFLIGAESEGLRKAFPVLAQIPPGACLVPGIVAGGAAAMGLVYLAIKRRPVGASRAFLRQSGIQSDALSFFLPALLGCFFIGNMLSDNPVAIHFWAALSKTRLFRGIIVTNPWKQYGTAGVPGWDRLFRDVREIGGYNAYCQGALYFLAFYGGFFLIVGLGRWRRRGSRGASTQSINSWSALQLVLVTTMPILFFHMDFVANAARAWIKSRFLEIPIYCILFISLYFMGVERARSRRVDSVILLFLIVAPILGTDRLAQWYANLKLLFTSFL